MVLQSTLQWLVLPLYHRIQVSYYQWYYTWVMIPATAASSQDFQVKNSTSRRFARPAGTRWYKNAPEIHGFPEVMTDKWWIDPCFSCYRSSFFVHVCFFGLNDVNIPLSISIFATAKHRRIVSSIYISVMSILVSSARFLESVLCLFIPSNSIHVFFVVNSGIYPKIYPKRPSNLIIETNEVLHDRWGSFQCSLVHWLIWPLNHH